MIHLSNKHSFEHMIASGALAFDGKGWWWERILVWFGLIRPELFTVVIKSLTRHPRKGNLNMLKPWTCVRLIPGGAVNKVGLTNPGIEWWCREVAPTIDFKKYSIVGSIFGTEEECVEMAPMFNRFPIKALEVNCSCPNSGHPVDKAKAVIQTIVAVEGVTNHPIIVKVMVDQEYLTVARELEGIAQAISLNSVPWETVFPRLRSALWRLEEKVKGGGGGVSGGPAQFDNWLAVERLVEQGSLPVIAPSAMSHNDVRHLRDVLKADAVSFGTMCLRKPLLPTQIVEKEMKEKGMKV